MAKDLGVKPYTLDDLATAMGHYSAVKAAYDAAVKMRNAKQAEIDSFQKEVDKADQQVQQHAATVRKIMSNMER